MVNLVRQHLSPPQPPIGLARRFSPIRSVSATSPGPAIRPTRIPSGRRCLGEHLIPAAECRARSPDPARGSVTAAGQDRLGAASCRSDTVDREPGSTTRSAERRAPRGPSSRYLDAGLTGQRVEVGRVREPWEADRGPRRDVIPSRGNRSADLQGVSPSSHTPCSQGSTPGRAPRSAGQIVEPGPQHVDIAAELVDHESRASAARSAASSSATCRTGRRRRRPGRCRRPRPPAARTPAPGPC